MGIKSFTKTKAEDLKKQLDTTPIPTEIAAKKELAADLRSTLSKLMGYYQDVIHPPYVKGYKNKFLYAGDRAMFLLKNNMKDKSNRKYPLIAAVHDTYFSNTYDTETDIKAIPQKESDKKRSKIVQQFIERGFSVSGAEEVYKDMDYEACLVGPAYGRVRYDKGKSDVIYKKGDVEHKQVIEKCNPAISYVDIFSLYFNPGAADFYKVPKFWRNIGQANIVRKKYKDYLTDVSDSEWNYILQNPNYVSSVDYSKVKMLKGFEGAMLTHNAKSMKDAVSGPTNEDLSFTDDNIYNVDYGTNLMEVVEYWEIGDNGTKFVLMINGYLLYDGLSDLPFEGDPFVRVARKETPGTLFPIGISQILDPIQDNVDNFVNNRCDVINQLSNPPFMADKGVFGPETPQIMSLKPRKVYERIQGKILERINTVDPNAVGSLLSGIQFFINQAYELIALNAYSQGGEGKVERSNGGAQIKANILKTALIPFVRNKNKTLTKTAERWMAFARVYMPDKFSVRILGADGSFDFAEITVEDILNQFDFEFNNYSMRSLSRLDDRASLSAALQYTQNPETRAALEEQLQKTFDIPVATMEDKKKAIDNAVELEKYKKEKMSEAGLLNPEQPGAPAGGAIQPGGSPESALSAVPTAIPEVSAEGVPPRERPVIGQ